MIGQFLSFVLRIRMMYKSQIELTFILLLRLSTQEWIFEIWKIALVNWGMTRCQKVFSRLFCKFLSLQNILRDLNNSPLSSKLAITKPNWNLRPQKAPPWVYAGNSNQTTMYEYEKTHYLRFSLVRIIWIALFSNSGL